MHLPEGFLHLVDGDPLRRKLAGPQRGPADLERVTVGLMPDRSRGRPAPKPPDSGKSGRQRRRPPRGRLGACGASRPWNDKWPQPLAPIHGFEQGCYFCCGDHERWFCVPLCRPESFPGFFQGVSHCCPPSCRRGVGVAGCGGRWSPHQSTGHSRWTYLGSHLPVG